MLDHIFFKFSGSINIGNGVYECILKNALLLVSQVAGGGWGQEVEGRYPACRSCPILEAAIRRPKDRLKIESC